MQLFKARTLLTTSSNTGSAMTLQLMLAVATSTVAASLPTHVILQNANGVQMPLINNGAWDLHHAQPSEAGCALRDFR
jgi:hypothetical protein